MRVFPQVIALWGLCAISFAIEKGLSAKPG